MKLVGRMTFFSLACNRLMIGKFSWKCSATIEVIRTIYHFAFKLQKIFDFLCLIYLRQLVFEHIRTRKNLSVYHLQLRAIFSGYACLICSILIKLYSLCSVNMFQNKAK